MKKYLFTIVLLLAFVSYGAEFSGREHSRSRKNAFRIATYNIRYQAKADEESGNPWKIRKQPLAALIQKKGFDLIGTQEGDAAQLADLKALLPGFDYVNHPYGGKSHDLHNCATFYRTDLFSVVDKGVFWFSETPDKPSIGWDATDRRIASWTKFRILKTGRLFYTFNVHFYWRLEKARAASGSVLLQKMKEIAQDSPAIAMGDFNSEPDESQIQTIKTRLSDAYEITASKPKGPVGTNLGGGVFQGPPKNRIDYIFVSPHFSVKDYWVFSDLYGNNRYPSDHLPVSSLLSF